MVLGQRKYQVRARRVVIQDAGGRTDYIFHSGPHEHQVLEGL